MQLVFRKFPAGETPPPAPREVYVRADPAHATEGQGVASIVLGHGPAALLQGPGPAERIVIDVAFTNPTLDDMLAATFAERLLEGGTLPEGSKPFADYAAAIRKGLRPTDTSPEDSIEGIFLAIRNAAGKDADLTDLQAGERFCKGWARMADCILQAAEQGINPLTASPFAGHPEFMQERAFLLRDREVYRQDVLRGERWLVRIPGGPEQASGLFLRQPTSLFFPHWSRTDPGSASLLLVVDWGEGVWVISTDPAQRLPIPSLAEALRAAEAARDPAGAAKDPWYDGGRLEHGHTLVAAPRGGTKLSEREVLHTVKKWARARPVRPAWPVRELALAAAAVVAVALLVLIYLKLVNKPDSVPDAAEVVTQDGQPIPRSGVQYVFNEQTGSREGVNLEASPIGPKAEVSFEIPVKEFTGTYNVPHAVGVKLKLRSSVPLAISQIGVKINDQAAKHVPFDFNPGSDKTEIITEPLVGDFVKGKNTVRVRIRSDSDKEQKVEVRADWPPEKTLYVLAVGVSTYPKARGSANDLPYASSDAVELIKAFKKQEGGLFHKVVCKDLIEGAATKQGLFDELRKLEKKATIYDLAVVALSGHGDLDDSGFWFFTPYDYDSREVESTAVFWVRGLDKYIPRFGCDTVLFVDTCHSGAVTKFSLENVFRSGARRGLVVFAASLSKQLAQEDSDWKHGALTLAVLEGIQNEYLYPKPAAQDRPDLPAKGKGKADWITLFDLEVYVRKRVKQLTASDQAVVVSSRADFDTQSIAIAPIKKGR
jgi:hypothetical protein